MNLEKTQPLHDSSADMDDTQVIAQPDSLPLSEQPTQIIAAPASPPLSEQATQVIDQPAPDSTLLREAATQVVAPLPPADGIPSQTLLVNTYLIERQLGGGGMGEVYLARHTGLGTKHAIKVIRPSMGSNTQVMDLFYREAKVLRGVRHDAVVNYDGFVRDEQGRDYLVMEYVHGSPLSDRLQQSPLRVADVLILRDRLCAGLAEAHRKGAVHRDLSPDNVILPDDQIAQAKLIDFGLCKLTDPDQQTIIGNSFAGKYRYASPEQFGLFGGVVDARSDLYSLGLVLVAAAQGRPLDMGESFAAALRSRQRVPDLSEVPAMLHDWLTAMLQPNPADRPASVDALLKRWPAATVLLPQPVDKQTDRVIQKRWWPPVVAVIVLLGGGGAYWFLRPLPVITPHPVSNITAPTAPPISTETVQPPAPPVADELTTLIQSDHLDNAFTLVQSRLASGHPPPVEQTWMLAERLRTVGKIDSAFALIRGLASEGYAAAAFALAEFYDPLHWSAATSPFSKPNAEKAHDWYQRAATLGDARAKGRLDALRSTEEATQ